MTASAWSKGSILRPEQERVCRRPQSLLEPRYPKEVAHPYGQDGRFEAVALEPHRVLSQGSLHCQWRPPLKHAVEEHPGFGNARHQNAPPSDRRQLNAQQHRLHFPEFDHPRLRQKALFAHLDQIAPFLKREDIDLRCSTDRNAVDQQVCLTGQAGDPQLGGAGGKAGRSADEVYDKVGQLRCCGGDARNGKGLREDIRTAFLNCVDDDKADRSYRSGR